MEDSNGREFTVLAVISGNEQEVFVQTSETTDGVTFYNCRVNNNDVAEIRKDGEMWTLIWGHLNNEDVKSIGEAIEGAVLED